MTGVPIRLRVAAAFAISMAVVLAGTGWLLYVRLGSHLSETLDRQLRVRTQDLAALIRESGTPLSDAVQGQIVERGESYAQLLDGSGRVVDATRPLGRSPILSRTELLEAQDGSIFAERETVPGLDEASRLFATPIVRDGKRLVLVVGLTSEEGNETLARLRNELLITGPIALLLASLAGYALAGLSLRPVESMRRRAAVVSAETPGERLPVPQTRDEIQRLAETLNGMLERLEIALERERDFVADAGHELRTPLALLRMELELALRHGRSREELLEAVRRSCEEVDRLAQLAEDLLLIARSGREGLPLRLETLDASELLASVARRFAWRAEEVGRPIAAVAAPLAQVLGDRIRLEQALGNLVDNALRHGGGKVRLSATSADGLVELHVADEGEGFPVGFISQAFERFARPDDARTRGGAGLGLSIVRAIAEAHGGSAHVTNRQEAGADAWVVLPSAAPGADEAREADELVQHDLSPTAADPL